MLRNKYIILVLNITLIASCSSEKSEIVVNDNLSKNAQKAKDSLSNNQKVPETFESMIQLDYQRSLVKMSHSINTMAYEYLPVLNNSKDIMFFTGMDRTGYFDFKLSHVDSKNTGGEDIFISERKNLLWTDARPIEFLNTNSHESVSYITRKNDLLITANYDENLGLKNGSKGTETTDIFIAKEKGGKYSIQHLPEPVNSIYFDSDGILNSTEEYLFFVSDRPGNIGEYHKKGWEWNGNLWGNTDIYVSEKTEFGWSNPTNLGPIINTEFSERFPWLSADGTTLYISSNAYTDEGDMNIYFFRRSDLDDWTNWDGPFTIKNVNTAAEEFGFKIYDDSSYFFARSSKLDFNSTQMGRGGDGAYRETNYRSGYELYGCQTVSLDKNSVVNIYSSQASKDPIFVMGNVCFDFDSWKIKKNVHKELNFLIDFLNNNPSKEVLIIGYTDDLGNNNYNLELSKNRAESVKNFLLSNECENVLIVKGEGENNPKYSNKGKLKEMNRRVEISFVE
jgi:outer membrane protein OmpA-like peptidoglycan-associated protein